MGLEVLIAQDVLKVRGTSVDIEYSVRVVKEKKTCSFID